MNIEKIKQILVGIDKTETESINGWWPASYGAEFGEQVLKNLIDYIAPFAEELEKLRDAPAKHAPEESDKNLCALKTITDLQVNQVARAFWRRIYAYRNDYGIELPKPLPVEFMAHMATALTWVDKPAQQIPEEAIKILNRIAGNWSLDYRADAEEVLSLLSASQPAHIQEKPDLNLLHKYSDELVKWLIEHKLVDIKNENLLACAVSLAFKNCFYEIGK